MIEAPKVNETECAYLAAILDQCGRVRVVREKRNGSIYRTLFMRVTKLSKAQAGWVLSKFGPGRCDSTSEGLEITFVTAQAAEVCVHAYPYLQVFKEHARLITKFATTMGAKRLPLTTEHLAIRAEVDREILALDRAGKGRR